MPLAFLLAACSGRLGSVEGRELSGEQPVPATAKRVRIEVEDGSLTLRPLPVRQLRYRGVCQLRADDDAQLAVLKRFTSDVQIAESDGTLVIRLPGVPPDADPLRSMVANQVVLELPSDLPLEVRASRRGHLSVEGWRAPVRLESGHGDLRLLGCRGPAVLRTAQGTTIAYDHSGDLDVQSRSGDIQAWVRDPGDKLRLITGAGNIQCMIPPDRPFQVRARTERGKVTNGFGLPQRRIERFAAAFDGGQGQGGTEILIRTGAGNLSLGQKRFE